MLLSTDDWVAQTQAALLADDDPPAIPFRAACLPEYRRRLLAVAAACTGHVGAEIHGLVAAASDAFEREDAAGWLAALGDLERSTGVVA